VTTIPTARMPESRQPSRNPAVPRAVLEGSVTLPLLALWIAFSCSRWFGLTGVTGLPDITLERICLAAVCIYAVARFTSGRHRLGRVLPVEIGLWLFGIASLLSGLRGPAVGEPSDVFNTVCNALLYPALAFMIVVRSRISGRDLMHFAAILTFFGCYLGVTMVLEQTALRPRLLPPSIGDPSVGIHFDRSRGPYLNAAFTGTVMVQLIPLAMLLRQLGSRGWKLFACVVIGLLCLGTYYSATRSCQLSLAVITILGALLPSPNRLAYRFLLGALLVGGYLGYTAGGTPAQRLGSEAPIDTRLNLLLATGEMVLDHPALGSGYGSFSELNQEYYNRGTHFGSLSYQEHWYQVGSHNTLLTPLAEMGVFLGGLYLFLMLRAVVRGLAWRSPARSTREEEQIRGLLGCGLLVGVAFLVNAIAFEFRYVLTPNALFWVFAAFAERHHALERYAALTGSNQVLRRPGATWAVGPVMRQTSIPDHRIPHTT
jgi:hypothetical protein